MPLGVNTQAQKNRQTDRQTDRHTHTYTNTHTHTHTHTHTYTDFMDREPGMSQPVAANLIIQMHSSVYNT